MRVSLIKKDKIKDILLPQKINGSYWVTDFDSNGNEQNLINIEATAGGWKLISNDEYYYFNNNLFINEVVLKEYTFYTIKSKKDDTTLLLYCSPIKDETYNCYKLTDNQEIKIGSSNKCHIIYDNKVVEKEHARIVFGEKGFVSIIDNKSRYGIYVNGIRVEENKKLSSGDVVFLMGLKIIILKIDDEYRLMINNPNNLIGTNLMLVALENEDQQVTDDQEEIEMELYKNEDYFNKKPRFLQKIEQLELNVDAPPAKQEEQDNSLLVTIGPMLTMSMTSLVSAYTTINNVMSNGKSWESAIPSLVICGTMFASVFVWPLITKRYEKSKRKRKEKERQKKYSKYINDKKEVINKTLEEQSNILREQYPDIKECENIILHRLTRLWERRINDEDFLTISLGKGSQPLRINIKYPEDHFSMVEDNLKNMVSDLGNTPKNMTDVPIDISLVETKLLALIGESNARAELTRQLLLQLVTFQSYDNLKIVMFTNTEQEHNWEFIKILPHNWTNDKSFRFFGSTIDEYKEICYNLEKIYSARKEVNNGKSLELDTRYVIVTDCINSIRNFEFIKKILDEEFDIGFSLIMLDNRIVNIPDQCQSFIQINAEKNEFYKNLINNRPLVFTYDRATNIDYYACAKELSNIPIRINDDSEGQLPTKIGFLEMYDVGKIEQLNIMNRWSKNNPILSLSAPLGVGKSGEKINIDLHEKYHGPHGLIAGMTGSGKSEAIITYILSMAINYHPYEVQFILIDYKGGGLAGAFENSTTGIKLPHLVGTITNLDANEIKRSLASIESELKRRQKLFNEAREISNESTIDIYKYQKMYRNGLVKEPISHLFIISDEFAELKNQQPEFMEQLISTARIGRSLGVHLILATQKPSGVVDPQIWSNTRFRICLRVQEKSDSNEVIKCPDAALLKQTGRFYFQVGFNEIFSLGQAAWAGGKYIPTEKIKKNIDSSLDFINNIGYIEKTIETKKKQENVASNGEELSSIVKHLAEIAKQERISCRPLWLEKIKEFITINELIKEFNYQKKSAFNLDLIVGKYDNPSQQSQHLLTAPITEEGNALIYGVAGSGKENMISTMIYSSMLYYHPNELNYYIIDFGSESLRMFKDSPLVGDIMYSDDKEKINNLYKMISKEIEERKKLFSDYNGDYLNYCKNSGKYVPNIVVIINNYEAYQETYSEFDDDLIVLTRDGSKYGIYFIITSVTPNGLRFKLKQNFNQNFVLQQNNEDDYSSILGSVQKNYPAKLFGRGIIKTDKVYEFQTAFVCEKDNIQNGVKQLIEVLKNKYQERAKKVPVLPEIVTNNDVTTLIGKTDETIIGLAKDDLSIITYDFSKNLINLVASNDISINYKFVLPFINQTISLNKQNIILINTEDFDLDEKYTNYIQYYKNNFDEIFNKLEKFVNEKYEQYKNNNYDKTIFKDNKPLYCIIIGIDDFKTKLNKDNQSKFGEIFDKVQDLDIINYIIVDSVDQIKKVEYDSWYKGNINNTDGIWIGNGLNDQFSIKVTQRNNDAKLDLGDNFCFVVKKGKAELVQYIEKFDIELK